MPPACTKHQVLVLEHSCKLALEEHLFRVFAAEERDLLGKLGESRVRMSKLACELCGLCCICAKRWCHLAH
jgi:hypothetical protein